VYKKIGACRICGNIELVPVLELGQQALTGVFPKSQDDTLTSGPLTLVKCNGKDRCGLLQLAHSYSIDEMYGQNYGYRSGLNPSMVAHLRSKVQRIEAFKLLAPGDIVIDIGSNDGTTLRQYAGEYRLAGFDPTGVKFRQYYPPNIQLITEFFSDDEFMRRFEGRKARVVTSFAMFYDLENPLGFMHQVHNILADDGIWVFEQSYMPAMLATNSYDTVCHEHLEYYALAQILWMAERVGFRVVDVEINDVNGGSFSVTAQKSSGRMPVSANVAEVLQGERAQQLDRVESYLSFAASVRQSRDVLRGFLEGARRSGKSVIGLGASTKGNVILQYCGVDTSLLPCIGEINPDKFGAFTPGTHIPIIREDDAIARRPDFALVLPWHFRKYFDAQSRYAALNLIYPLPTLSGANGA
jgi:cyclopropane fatty-acyl-phospholipid synthase-like methyltransferase